MGVLLGDANGEREAIGNPEETRNFEFKENLCTDLQVYVTKDYIFKLKSKKEYEEN